MTATKKTTIKPYDLGYRAVGSDDAVPYTELKGLLHDFALAQDAADEAPIDAEFYTNPWAIVRTGKPIKMTFTLVNYGLDELPPIIGGTYTAATDTAAESFVGVGNDFSSEWEWKVSYKKGNAGFVILRGDTAGNLGQANNAALGYSITITALAIDGSDNTYKIIGDPKTGA